MSDNVQPVPSQNEIFQGVYLQKQESALFEGMRRIFSLESQIDLANHAINHLQQQLQQVTQSHNNISEIGNQTTIALDNKAQEADKLASELDLVKGRLTNIETLYTTTMHDLNAARVTISELQQKLQTSQNAYQQQTTNYDIVRKALEELQAKQPPVGKTPVNKTPNK